MTELGTVENITLDVIMGGGGPFPERAMHILDRYALTYNIIFSSLAILSSIGG